MKKLFILFLLASAVCQAQNPNYSKPTKRQQKSEPAPECYTTDEIKIGAHIAAFKAYVQAEGLKGNFYKSTEPGYEQYFTYLDRNQYTRKDGTVGYVSFQKSYYFRNDTCITVSFLPQLAPKELALAQMETTLGPATTQQAQDGFTRYSWSLPELRATALFDTRVSTTNQGNQYEEYSIVFLRQGDTPKLEPYLTTGI